MFLYWTGNGNEFCVEPRSDHWWGAQRPFIQFKNGQLYSEDCIGKLKPEIIMDFDLNDPTKLIQEGPFPMTTFLVRVHDQFTFMTSLHPTIYYVT